MKILVWAVVVLLVLVLVNVFRLVMQNNRVPELGVDNGLLKPLSSKPNAVSTQARDVEKRVQPLPFKASRDATVQAIKTAVAEYGGAELKRETPDYLYYVFTTPTMHFHDDVEFYLDEPNRVVHFRSASRAGYSDMGLNRKRFERLKELYQQAGVTE